MDSGPERQVIIDRMLAILRHDTPWVWGFHPKDYTLRHSLAEQPQADQSGQ